MAGLRFTLVERRRSSETEAWRTALLERAAKLADNAPEINPRYEAGGGSIINLASNAGLLPRAHDPVYSISKGALVAEAYGRFRVGGQVIWASRFEMPRARR